MKSRAKLQAQLTKAWVTAISKDYRAQRINSERSLQASFWARIHQKLSADSRRMFIEPGLVSGSRRKYPDLVICNSQSVIGIVELKYLPRVKPDWEKDIKTFQWILKHRDKVKVSNKRFRGIATDNREYTLAKDVLFVWAGVHAGRDTSIREKIPPELTNCFLELHAETSRNQNVRIYDGRREIRLPRR